MGIAQDASQTGAVETSRRIASLAVQYVGALDVKRNTKRICSPVLTNERNCFERKRHSREVASRNPRACGVQSCGKTHVNVPENA